MNRISGFETFRWMAVLPYLTLLLWMGLLLSFHNGQPSLMAHDEGYYAQQARWILETGDWVTPQWWGQPNYDRPIGIQWLIAATYRVLGVSEASARLPSRIACLVSVLLTYAIGSQLLNRRLAWLGAAILCVTPLWVQYGQLATQDMVLVMLELIGIWALLQAETRTWTRWVWGMLAGSMLGLGFLIKGFMILLPPVALLPYLMSRHRQARHLLNPGLYLGLVLGALPLAGWFWASWRQYGSQPFEQLVGKLLVLGQESWYGHGPFYYLWNIPANAFPWPLFSLMGAVLLWQDPGLKRLLGDAFSWRSRALNFSGHGSPVPLLLGYPLVLLVLLSIFKTRTPYYALQLLPWMALLAGIAIAWLFQLYIKPRAAHQWIPASFSYAFGGLAGLGIGLGWAILSGARLPGLPNSIEVQQYSVIALALGLGWLGLPFLWALRRYASDLALMGRYWLVCWLVGPWLALMAAGLTGVYGDYSPEVKAFLRQPQVATILQTAPVNFVIQDDLSGNEHKTWVLLSFYTPNLGRQYSQTAALVPGSYAWVSPQIELMPAVRYQSLGQIQGWQLVQVNRVELRPKSKKGV